MDNTTAKNTDSDLSDGNGVKTCADCGTSKTPLWRGGPAGPKSLCNACGIRSRKKKRSVPCLNKSSSSSSSEDRKKKKKKCSKKLLALGSEVSWKRPRSTTAAVEELRKKLGEAEQAAVLLMALSCGSVYG